MNGLIDRQAAISIPLTPKGLRKYHTCNLDDAYNEGWGDYQACVSQLPPARPDNQVNLCDSCRHTYPDCPSGKDDVIFGNGIGNDNICACAKYVPSAQPEPLKITIDHVPTADELERIKQAMRDTPVMLLPSAQLDIIRCKDCKHRYVDGVNVRFNVCELNHNKVQGDEWYCADAERRTDG